MSLTSGSHLFVQVSWETDGDGGGYSAQAKDEKILVFGLDGRALHGSLSSELLTFRPFVSTDSAGLA